MKDFHHAAPAFGITVLAIALCAACTPQQALLQALIPDGTVPTVLGNMQGVKDENRQRIAEMEHFLQTEKSRY